MKNKILLILIFVSFVKAYGDDCNVIGQCENAQISHLITTSTPLDCLRRCVGFDDCKWYTFKSNEEDRNCELFRTCESIVDDTNFCKDHACISGQNTCPSEPCEMEGFCLGTVITSYSYQKEAFFCDYACQIEPTGSCKYYAYSTKYYNCYLFEDCPSVDETVVEFQSSQVGCPLICEDRYDCRNPPP